MATTPTFANLATRSIGLTNQLAELLQFNSWEVEDGSYNGVKFHIIVSNFNQINPAAGVVNYLNSFTDPPPFGADTGAVHMADVVVKKLGIYRVPNSNSDIIEDYGLASPNISVMGIMTGVNYSSILTHASKAFLDEPTDRTQAQNQQVGALTGANFRVLVHPFFGEVKNVFLQSWRILHSSNRFQSVFFELNLIPQKSTYLSNSPDVAPWQQNVQDALDFAEALIASINQTFSLVTGLTTNTFPFNKVSTALQVPLIDTGGVYLSFTQNQLELQLQNLSDIFLNSVAYFVQNSGQVIANSFFDVVEIDFSLLPIFTGIVESFTYSDAQSLITNYSNQVNQFITLINNNNFDFFMQPNISALQNSVQTMDEIAGQILLQDNQIKTIITNKALPLTEIIVQNGGSLDDFDTIAQLNNGNYFSSSYIPPGSAVDIIL